LQHNLPIADIKQAQYGKGLGDPLSGDGGWFSAYARHHICSKRGARQWLENPPYTPDIQAAFDAIMPAGVDPLVLFRTLAVNARVYERFRAGGLLDRGLLTLRQREIVIDRTCALNDCEYEWGVHIAFFAAKVKFTPEQIAATVRGTNAEWKEDERVLLDVCEELDATRSISDDLWARLTLHFSSAQILEIIGLVGFYRTVSLYANALRLPLEPYAARFPATPTM
jgi:alkylhydroperoxidase family enzyme